MMFLDCPEYLDQDGTVRCGLPAEVRRRFTMRSTDGPIEAAMIRCPAGHWFNGPVESLTWESRGGGGRSPVQAFPAEPVRKISRPNTAPAYYLGRPAWLWITAMRPRTSATPPPAPALPAPEAVLRPPRQLSRSSP
jgi:hypothetical protein